MAELLVVPRAPGRLRLEVERLWDGSACPDARAHGCVTLASEEAGLRMTAELPHQVSPRIPDAPPGTRVADLWEYDVVECFLAGADGSYLEVELGAGGHFLVLSFRAPRERSDDHAALELPVEHRRDTASWRSEVLLPWPLIPPDLCALNAFVSAAGRHLAHTPLPGPHPDFHQPTRWGRGTLVR